MRKALLTFGVDEAQDWLTVSRPLFETYAQRHGYDLICPEQITDERPASWIKVKQMQHYLPDYDFILWLDADIVIVDGTEDITADIETGAMQAIVKHHTKDGEVPNFGVWALRNTPATMDWLALIWAQEQHTLAPWWEQTAALELMGYTSTQRPCRLNNPTDWYHRTYFLPICWNSHPWYKATRPKFEHVTMYDDRLGTMQALARKAKWHEQP